MARTSRANRVDANQQTLVEDLRMMGMSVQVLSNVGDGCPDILVGYGGRNYLFEIKDPEKEPARRQLTPDQRIFFDQWRGQCEMIHEAEDVIAVIKTQMRLKP